LPPTLPRRWLPGLWHWRSSCTARAEGRSTSTSALEGGRVVVSDAAAAMVMAAGSVANGGIDDDDPVAAAMSADDAASSMMETGKCNKNGTKDIGIQALDAILQLGVGC